MLKENEQISYKICRNIDECRSQLANLVDGFGKLSSEEKKSYSEAQLRVDFINPFLKSFGWDVDNVAHEPQSCRHVIQEESIDVEEENRVTKKKPDYTLKQLGQRCLLIEAKKADVDILSNKESAFQIRRYGWNARLPFSALTNFEYIVFYECINKPEIEDLASNSRYKKFSFKKYLDNLEELYSLISFTSIKSGSLSTINTDDFKGGDSFDKFFLNQIESWRENLAENIVINNSGLSQEEINFSIQRIINKIVFLRICEDRAIEKYETLRQISSYKELKTLFKSFDIKYNSGLFSYIENDLAQEITIDDQVLLSIFSELYYPVSPYDFSVIDSDILSQIYEQFLGRKIELASDYSFSLVQEPEVVASNGVVPTPKKIVDMIVSQTLKPLYEGAEFDDTLTFKILDACCGSGTFLLSVYDYILQHHEKYYLASYKENSDRLIESSHGQFSLSLSEKHNILINNIFGVDINPYAVEVTQFSLLLKLIENENAVSIENFLRKTGKKILPNLDDNIKCGNSLLDDNYFNYNKDAEEDDNLLFKLNPFNWYDEFPFLEDSRGFNAIVGNPPYVRIQNFIKYSPDEMEYYRSKASPYTYSKKDSFDKYYIFFERAISLLREGGRVGYIVPHKFFINTSGKKLRKYITNYTSLDKIIHFGVTQVFPNRSTYTAIIILAKQEKEKFQFSRVDNLQSLDFFQNIPVVSYKNESFNSFPWVFISKEADILFKKILSTDIVLLKEIADIPVGLQTSADQIFIFTPTKENDTHYYFTKNEIEYRVEKDICRPCLYDTSFNCFDTVSANSRMIFPYKISGENAILISETDFENNHPNAWQYLNLFKSNLEARSISGKDPKWYQYGRNQSLTKFHDVKKIVFPVLSRSPNYIIDETNFQFTGGGNGPYYSIIPSSEYSVFYIAALLSHPILEAMVKSRTSEFKGEYYSHGRQFIENLPIKTIDFSNDKERKAHDNLCNSLKSIIEAKKQLDKIKIPSKKSVINRKLKRLHSNLINQINNLYGFTQEDIDCISGNNLFIVKIET